jgi:hypothetical protein
MKWNFECRSERRDYLHDHLVPRSNGFCAFGKIQMILADATLTCARNFMPPADNIPPRLKTTRRSLRVAANIQSAILLTAMRLFVGLAHR